jgi:hypothetical protein
VKCGPQGSGSAACSKLRAMSLDGLRAWIGEVERKLGVRTRVFLVLIAIAIGGAATGIYLALEAANESVSKSEVQALQERAEATAAGNGVEAAAVAALKAELETLRAQLSELQSEKGANGGASGSTPPGAEKKVPHGGASASPKGGAAESSNEKLKELLEKTK